MIQNNMSSIKRLRSETVPFFIIVAFAYLFFLTPLPADNVLSRADLTVSMVNDRSFNINKYAENTLDKSERDGNFYSDKAPGVSFTSLPAAYVYKLFKAPDPADSIFIQILTIFSVSLPALALVFIFYQVAFLSTASANAALLSSASLFLGTLFFPYSTLLYGHVPGAVISFYIFYVVFFTDMKLRHCMLCGALSAWLVGTEYPLALHSLALFLFFAVRHRNVKYILAYVCSALVVITVFLAYNKACYGEFFSIGYFHESLSEFNISMGKGIAGVRAPAFNELVNILFNSGRGLFVVSPFLLLAAPGLFMALRMKEWRAPAAAAALMAISSFAINSGQYLPLGGMAPGPRHLVPIIPYLVFLAAFTLRLPAIRKYVYPSLAAASMLFAFIFAVVEPHVHQIFDIPLFEFYIPSFKNGILRTSWISLFSGGGPSPAVAVLFISLSSLSVFLVSRLKINTTAPLLVSCVAIALMLGLQYAAYQRYKSDNEDNKTFILGSAWEHSGYQSLGIAKYREVLKINPRHALTLFSLGNIELKRRNFNGALSYYTDSVASDPNFFQSRFNLGRIYLQAQDYENALLNFEAAARNGKDENRSKLVYCYRRIAEIYYRFGDIEKAKSYEEMAHE